MKILAYLLVNFTAHQNFISVEIFKLKSNKNVININFETISFLTFKLSLSIIILKIDDGIRYN